MMTTPEDVLSFNRKLIGIHEVPDGSNIAPPITTWARKYGYSTGDAWCAWEVSYVIWNVDPSLLPGMQPTGYSGAFRAWGEKHGRLIPRPEKGAIDVMNFDLDPSFTDHVGIVESVHNGYWICIEGNHKNQVMREERSFADGQHWFVLPMYEVEKIISKRREPEMIVLENGEDFYWTTWVNLKEDKNPQVDICYRKYGEPTTVRATLIVDRLGVVSDERTYRNIETIPERPYVSQMFKSKIDHEGGVTIHFECLGPGGAILKFTE